MKIDRLKKTRTRRKYRSKRDIFGTADRPRLSVFRSNKHIYAQIIDDYAGVTLASSSTMTKSVQGEIDKYSNIAAAQAVGTAIAKQAMNVGIKCVSFDRNGYRFHGRVKALADAARKAGLAF